MKIGAKVTLRGERMYAFFDKLVNIVLPRIRDFRGMSRKSFDGRGNYTLGLREQLVFPEINYDKVDKVRGMDIVIVTTAKNDEEATEFLTEMGMPLQKAPERQVMAKTSLIEKSKRKPKFKSARSTTAAKCAVARAAYYRKFGMCRICFRENAHRGFIPGVTKARGKDQWAVITDPIADMLTRIRNANTAHHQTVDVPASRLKKAVAKILLDEGFITGLEELKQEGPRARFRITLKYGPEKEKVITGLRRISRPGLRVYTSKTEIPRCWAGWVSSSCRRRRASCRASAPSAKASAVKSWRTCGSATHESELESFRSPFPSGVDVDADGSRRPRQGPQGRALAAHPRRRRRHDRRTARSWSPARATTSRGARRTVSRAR